MKSIPITLLSSQAREGWAAPSLLLLRPRLGTMSASSATSARTPWSARDLFRMGRTSSALSAQGRRWLRRLRSSRTRLQLFFFKLKNWRWMKRLKRSRTSYPRHWVKTKLKYYFGEDMFWSDFDKDTWIFYAKTVEVSNEPDNPGIKESICWNVLSWYTAIKF